MHETRVCNPLWDDVQLGICRAYLVAFIYEDSVALGGIF
jgi:hypothetical protein